MALLGNGKAKKSLVIRVIRDVPQRERNLGFYLSLRAYWLVVYWSLFGKSGEFLGTSPFYLLIFGRILGPKIGYICA